ncbi:MAG: universal stress protein [Hymenobacteraceae bacterium]|nr:universal stress protein [Hymenobacteraceae bacterium]
MTKATDVTRILVSVQFNEAGEQLLAYAGELAKAFGAELILLHTTQAQQLTFTQQSRAIHTLRCFGERVLMRQYKAGSGFARFECVIRPGSLRQSIKPVVQDYKVDLVLLEATPLPSTTEAKDNHAAAVMEQVDCPVMVVPPAAHFRQLNNLVFTTDFTDRDPKVLDRIANFAQQAQAKLTLVQIVSHKNKPQLNNLKAGIREVEQQLKGANTTIKLLEEEDMLEGISDFAEREQANMLILATQDNHLMERLFSTNYVKTMAYHTQIPLLVFRQQKNKPCSGCCTNCAGKLKQPQTLLTLPTLGE